MSASLIQPLELIEKLKLLSKINKITLKFDDQIVDNSFNLSQNYVYTKVLKFSAINTLLTTILSMIIQQKQTLLVQLSYVVFCSLYLILIRTIPKHMQYLNKAYVVISTIIIYLYFIVVLYALKNHNLALKGTPIEYYLQGFLFAFYVSGLIHCIQNSQQQIAVFVSFIVIAVFYSEILTTNWIIGLQILFLCLYLGGIIYIKDLHSRVMYLLNCHSLKMLNRLRNIMHSDLPNAIIVLENDEQQNMQQLFHNKAFEKLFQDELPKSNLQSILQRVRLQADPSITLIQQIKQKMTLHVSFQNPRNQLGLQHDNNVDREFFQLENCVLLKQRQAEAEASYNRSLVAKYLDVKCIRAYWEEKESIILILDDSQQRLEAMQEIQRKLATEIFGYLKPRLKSMQKVFEKPVSTTTELQEVGVQNIQFLKVILNAFEQTNKQSEDLNVRERDQGLITQNANLESSDDSWGSYKFRCNTLRVNSQEEEVLIQQPSAVFQVDDISSNNYEHGEQRGQSFLSKAIRQQPNRKRFKNKQPFFTNKYLDKYLQIIFGDCSQDTAVQCQHYADTRKIILRVLSKDNLKIYNNESKVIALIVLCIENLRRNCKSKQKYFDVHLNPSGSLLHICICLAHIPSLQRDSYSLPENGADDSITRNILKQIKIQTQNVSFINLCRRVLGSIGPQNQRFYVKNAEDYKMSFLIYNRADNSKKEDMEEQKQEFAENVVKGVTKEGEMFDVSAAEQEIIAAGGVNAEQEQQQSGEYFENQYKSFSKQSDYTPENQKDQQEIIDDLRAKSQSLKIQIAKPSQQQRSSKNQSSMLLQNRRQNRVFGRKYLSFEKLSSLFAQEGSILHQPGLANPQTQLKHHHLNTCKKKKTVLHSSEKHKNSSRDEEENTFNFCMIKE